MVSYISELSSKARITLIKYPRWEAEHMGIAKT